MAEITISPGSAADIDRLQPLWTEIHRHHRTVLPHLAPYVSDETSWTEHRVLYDEALARPDTVLLLAHDGEQLVGYGLAHVTPTAQSWAVDTWQTGDRIGEIESLGVLPGWRGHGLGDRLLTGLIDALREQGVDDLVLGVLPTNDAMRLYERHGFQPTWTFLSRFAGR